MCVPEHFEVPRINLVQPLNLDRSECTEITWNQVKRLSSGRVEPGKVDVVGTQFGEHLPRILVHCFEFADEVVLDPARQTVEVEWLPMSIELLLQDVIHEFFKRH